MRTIEIFNDYPTLHFTRKSIQTLFHALDKLQNYSFPTGVLSIAFLRNQQLTELHERFLNNPSPTDVITFLGDSISHSAGEICVSVDCASKVAQKLSIPFAHELTLYLVHGWLHLTGLSDLEPTAYTLMKEHEAHLMDWIVHNHLLPNFTLGS